MSILWMRAWFLWNLLNFMMLLPGPVSTQGVASGPDPVPTVQGATHGVPTVLDLPAPYGGGDESSGPWPRE